MRPLFAHRMGPALALFTGALLLSTLTRLALLGAAASNLTWDASLVGALLAGFVTDLLMAAVMILPYGIFLAFLPSRLLGLRWVRWALIAMAWFGLALFTLIAVTEWFFWEEFSVRFNFVAVDYLVYTTEVVANMRQSYNIPLVMAICTGLPLAYLVLLGRTGAWTAWSQDIKRWRWQARAACVAFPALLIGTLLGLQDDKSGADIGFGEKLSCGLRNMGRIQPAFDNQYNAELAKNGPFSFVEAFWSNALDYDRFYATLPEDDAFKFLRADLAQDNVSFLSNDLDDITRHIANPGPEKHWNVIQVTVESLSAEYIGCHGNPEHAGKNLTPNLDAIAPKSVWFRNLRATGTRTVRGMEALSLAIPPVPGQSVLRRPNCENLFTLGSVFRSRGYDTVFLYGGNGFFDNMNYFFRTNGYRIVDKPAKVAADNPRITFENAWGVCDEDLFDWSIAEADKAWTAGKPFHHFVMTTSNHRPFTWPDGRIDIPSGIGSRDGAVKYTDYAIGRFLREAAARPWFANTVFVFVADHCANVAGRQELEVNKYEIPLFVYAPGLLEARKVETLCSQIDYAPTLLGLMNWSYDSRFMGIDVLRKGTGESRAFISNYQRLGELNPGELTVLSPGRVVRDYACDMVTGQLTPTKPIPSASADTITYYQCAAHMLKTGHLMAIGTNDKAPAAVTAKKTAAHAQIP